MAYCTADDLALFLGESKLSDLSDPDGGENYLSDAAQAVIAAAIADADAEIDEALSAQYAVPVTDSPVPPRLVLLSKRLASFNLYQRRREAGEPEEGRLPYEDVKKSLAAIREGKEGIPGLTVKTIASVIAYEAPDWIETF